MSFHWSDNVHTTAFTPRDYQVELLAAAREKNIVICLAHNSSKEFIALKLLQELAHEVRNTQSKKVSLYITNGSDGLSAYNLIHHLTDLAVVNVNVHYKDSKEWENLFETSHVVILSATDCLNSLICGYLYIENVNVLIIEDCHKRNELRNLVEIFKNYYQSSKCKPKVLGLAGPLHNAGCPPAHLQSELAQLERIFDCKAETASDIVTVLRYCARPTENILQCAPPKCDEVIFILQNIISCKKAFIEDHRYDPSEIYSDEFLEELQAIPDPKKEPLEFLESFLLVLNEMGPWCADRAAFNLLVQIEKQKVKTPYERHFMLLCLISTAFVEIRSYCDYLFQNFDNEKQRIENFSSPKVLRLLEILKHFKPNEAKLSNNKLQSPIKQNSRLKKVSEEIEILDFKELGDKALCTIRNVEELMEKDSASNLFENLESILIAEASNEKQSINSNTKNACPNEMNAEDALSKSGSTRQKYKRKHTTGGNRNRHYNNNSTDPDALCGLIFCNDKNIAKILFSLLFESSKNDPDLNFLNVQYTVDRVADPVMEAKEAELEHRKQEEVLKRFRMHDCNLLIGTSVLEEGIDLPKCNLVIRWDPPQTYRSYVQCKGRARASSAFHIILVAPTLDITRIEKCPKNDPWENVLCCTDQNETENDGCTGRVEKKVETSEQKLNKTSIESTDEIKETSEKLYEDEIRGRKNGYQSKQLGNCRCTATNPRRDADEMYKLGLEKMELSTNAIVACLAQYIEIEKMLLAKCDNTEPFEAEHINADRYTGCVEPYRTSEFCEGASVNLGSAVALVNKYCAKLPSDTFTKLTPLWRCSQTKRKGDDLFLYTIRLPINSPLKYDIKGITMPTKILARRAAALIACKLLHECGELDDSLMPIGKEGFKASESDWEQFELEKLDEKIISENIEPRPGTTKRRQYYYKRIATAFSHCRPTVGSTAYLYHIKMTLECPIPEEQNTRGRKVYPPEDAFQGFGILILKKIPKVSAFPIFTRSGEVRVSLELSADNISLADIQINHINTFLNYTFTNVLRLQKFLMLFDAEATENCFFVVPTIRGENTEIKVDWKFLELISQNCNKMPKPVPDEVRKGKEFDANKFKDAVVMPWYRNQDQPQYFYVAEICNHLSPQSSFPGENYSTFQEYYFRKYGLTIQNLKQPLLDVDHTSARLNFLTPRYVNRKGVALPTSSEETKRAKRENLEQKQILVPELCTIHPFPASLWRAAVCLPCILYRINALLLADEIRKQVSYDLGLGRMAVEEEDFEWPSLDFGWSLAEVLKKSKEAKLAKTTTEFKGLNSSGRTTEAASNEEPNGTIELEESKSSDGDVQANENPNEKTANDLLEEAHEKLKSECLMEIGTWSNDMAENIDSMDQSDEEWGLLPPNVNLCSRNNTKIRYGSPTSWDVGKKSDATENYFSDSDVSYNSDEDYGTMSIDSNENQSGPLRIEFKSDNVAEAIETEEEIIKRQKQLAIIENSNANEKNYQSTKNIESGFDCFLELENDELVLKSATENKESFTGHILSFMHEIRTSNTLVRYNNKFAVSKKEIKKMDDTCAGIGLLLELVPYMSEEELRDYFEKVCPAYDENLVKFSIADLLELNRIYLSQNNPETYEIEGTGDIFDNFSDSHFISIKGSKKMLTDYLSADCTTPSMNYNTSSTHVNTHLIQLGHTAKLEPNEFSFDYQPDLNNHPGPSPSIILQALTMSNANDGINLERLETIGDSFLKYAITTYLYCKYENVHEGKLSHLRSKQVSNLNLYRLGRLKVLGECMIATKFEPHDNWLPPCYYVPKELEKALIEARIPACHWNLADLPNIKALTSEEICKLVKKKAETLGLLDEDDLEDYTPVNGDQLQAPEDFPCFIPYNLVTQHSIPDKSIADCVEALIGAYLIECGPRGALLFMAWLGIRVLPVTEETYCSDKQRNAGSTQPNKENKILIYGEWRPPKTPLLSYAPNPIESLELFLDGYDAFEDAIGYRFFDRSYLLQAMTHASYSPNRLSDCYQRLEFLGDAVLDYLITRHLYEDPRQHSPGALTDLRSALVNNTIFASLAVRHGFHKFFRHLSPGLNEVIDRFVRIQHENGHSISEEYYLLSEEECDEAEDVEVPKALGDVFESVAGAIFLDSNMSLDTVWKVYSNMMRPEIEQFSNSVPKSPIRELLELEPETAKFSKPEKLADGRRVRVTVEVFGKGNFRGIGRNYRIAKCTAAKCALRQLKKKDAKFEIKAAKI